VYNQPGQAIYLTGTTYNGLDIGNNLAYNSDGSIPQTYYNHSKDIWAVNPMFVNPAAMDYHLQAGSPAIDAGYDLTGLVTEDYDSNPRPQGAGYDIGAFEYMGGGSCVLPGDVNCDGVINLVDLRLIANDFGKTSGLNNPKSDTNSNGIVDIFDVVYVASRFT
jgi:hypothetical protein